MKVTPHNLDRVAKCAQAAADNEQVTRVRVDALEKGIEGLAAEMGGFVGRGFWGRLRWLFLGD
jgi:hypothetical protein